MAYFSAGVQYDDWRGQVAADDADLAGIRDYVRESGLIKDGDTVVGVTFYAGGENFISISALVVRGHRADEFEEALQHPERKLPLESVDLDLSISEFFKHFKRFNIALAPNGLELIGREYDE
ncbi:hypothetical protein [Cupriavidus gilardii]|uniref:hypothetical protein n=1 Tax=Cupriavidus gilardii TaxID=82541 RepID=UPI001574AA9A|nr:hypothetical protein [Cupriavidus gilardii]NSX04797.1 hypothetical protein [Cupriavidus gilardii]UXC35167.1 hypothetical protein N4G38_12200 [Cupriavidus gilardii]